MTDVSNVTELSVGKYDAIRTLRQALIRAEKGEITNVIILCDKEDPDDEDRSTIWADWSLMDTARVNWFASWFRAYINRRYFSGHGLIDEDD